MELEKHMYLVIYKPKNPHNIIVLFFPNVSLMSPFLFLVFIRFSKYFQKSVLGLTETTHFQKAILIRQRAWLVMGLKLLNEEKVTKIAHITLQKV